MPAVVCKLLNKTGNLGCSVDSDRLALSNAQPYIGAWAVSLQSVQQCNEAC